MRSTRRCVYKAVYKAVYLAKNQQGMSLVQVMVAVAIMGIVMASFSSMMVAQSREASNLANKMAVMNTQQLLMTLMSTSDVCTKVITDRAAISPTNNEFNSALIGTSTPPVVNLGNVLPTNDQAGAPPAISVGETSLAAPIQVAAIQIGNIQITAPLSPIYRAELQVFYNHPQGNRSVKPAAVPIFLSTTGTGTVRITSCRPANADAAGDVGKPCDTAPMGWGGGSKHATIQYSWGGNKRHCCMMDIATDAVGQRQNSGNGGTTALFTCYQF